LIKILDREFFKTWLLPSLSSLIVFLVLFFVGDLLGATDDLLENWPGLAVLAEYYIFRLTYLSFFFIPMAVLLGGFWGLYSWRDNNEWTIALTGGRHPFRLLLLPIISLFLLTVLISLYSLYLFPTVANRAIFLRDVKIKGKKPETISFENIHFRLREGRSIKIDSFAPEDKLLKGILITERDSVQLIQRLDAKKATYLKNQGWLLQNITRRIFHESGEHRTTQIDTELIALPPPSFLTSILETSPRHSKKHPEQYNTDELLKTIRFRQQRGMDATAELVFLHWKLSFPLSILALGLTGLLLGIRADFSRAGGIGFCLLLSFSYWIIFNSFIALGTSASFTFLSDYLAAITAAYFPLLLLFGFNFYIGPSLR
jgi:lipopolysaccharide export LptBFGC system permease protein LptF